VQADVLFGLPEWLLVGIGLGILCSLLVAGLFVAADRYFSDQSTRYGRQSGENRRRTELRAYLDAIDEQYAENHFVEGQHVAFYLPKRDVAITFDARAYYRIERSATVPVLVEHEMPGVQLGYRLPFEVPDVGFGQSEADAGPTDANRRDPTDAAFAELGLSTSATLEEVKAAYREKVKDVHPDQGGDEREFKRVREAYTTAKKHAS
jgi:hypothetical protein